METALLVAQLIISLVLISLVVLQTRAQGMQNRDAGSIYRTRRGLELTLFQSTIVVSAVFLVLALILSLPLFVSGTPVTLPAGG